MSGRLRHCPTCREPWPEGREHDLRSFGWLDGLPRSITPSNVDCLIHDGGYRGNRFLVLETKRANEPWQVGQMRQLMALAEQPRFVVRVLKGTLDRMSVHRVTSSAVDESGFRAAPDAFRGSVSDWLNGEPWRDPARPVVPLRTCPSCQRMHAVGTTCAAAA